MPFDVGGEHVSASAYSLDELGVPAVILKFFPQATDGDIYRTVKRSGLPSAKKVEKHVTGQNTVGAFEQREKQVVFATRQRDFGAIRIQQAAACEFENPAGKDESLGFRAAASRFGGFMDATKNGADAGEKLTWVERLRHIIVSPEFEADYAVRFLVHRREHDDGHIILIAQPAGEIQSGFSRQHQVEHDQMIMPLFPDTLGFPCVSDAGDAHLVALEKFREEIADFAVIIDDQNVRCVLHVLQYKRRKTGCAVVVALRFILERRKTFMLFGRFYFAAMTWAGMDTAMRRCEDRAKYLEFLRKYRIIRSVSLCLMLSASSAWGQALVPEKTPDSVVKIHPFSSLPSIENGNTPFADASRDMPTGDNPETVASAPEPKEVKPDAGVQTGTLIQAQLGGLIDRDVKGPDGSDLGHIVNVLVDARGAMQAVVLDVGGFLGVGNRQVVVATALLHITGADRKSPVIVRVPAAAIRGAPAYRPDNPDVSVLTGPVVEEESAPKPSEEKEAPAAPVTPPPPSGGRER